MAYDRARDLDLFELNLEHHPGLSMRVRRPGFAGERAVRRWWPVLSDPDAPLDDKAGALAALAGALADALTGWTLRLDSLPVPCTRARLLRLDTEFLLEVTQVWVERVVLRPSSVDVELDDDADDGDALPEPDEALGGDPAGGPFELDEEWLAQLPTTPPIVDAPGELEEVAAS